jgi:hypothetical protein
MLRAFSIPSQAVLARPETRAKEIIALRAKYYHGLDGILVCAVIISRRFVAAWKNNTRLS